jgi:predicted amidohydrolase
MIRLGPMILIDREDAVDDTTHVTVAAVQTDPQLRDVAGNLDRIASWIRHAADEGAELVVFPECAVNGYRYESREEALEDAQPVPGPATDRLQRVAAETGTYVAVGIVERDGDRLYNCAALIGPSGLVTKYRKTHIPFQAVDRFVTPGDIPLHVVETPIGRIGMVICYDLRFPEPARVLALSGVQIIANLTNLPPPGWVQPEFIFRARAAENRVWLVCADRVGTERGVEFIGRSAIVSPSGVTLAEAGETEEELLIQHITPEEADQKDLVFDPGVYEMHLLGDRRADLYGRLTASEARVEEVL